MNPHVLGNRPVRQTRPGRMQQRLLGVNGSIGRPSLGLAFRAW